MAARLTLLQICQGALNGIKDVAVPNTIIGNPATEAVLLKSFASKVGRELERGYKWQTLKREYSFPTTGVAAYVLPGDYRKFAALTFWDRTGSRPLALATDVAYQALKSGIVVSGIRYYFQISGDMFNIVPTPPAGLTIAYNYFSSQFCQDAVTGLGLDDWTTDNDVCRLDGDLVTLGVNYRYLNRVGAPFAEEKADYLQAAKDLSADDTPSTIIDVGRSPAGLGEGNFPDGSWPI